MRDPSYLIREYPLQQGALEIAYIEEYFNEFPERKTAADIIQRLEGREYQILMAEAPLPDDGSAVVPVSYKVSHELREHETDPKLADLVRRLDGVIEFSGRKVLYNWLGATRLDWRGKGHFRAVTEEQEVWAVGQRLRRDRRQDQEPVLRHARDARQPAVQRHQARTCGRSARVEGVPQQAARPLRARRASKPAARDEGVAAGRMDTPGTSALVDRLVTAGVLREFSARDPQPFVAEGRFVVRRMLALPQWRLRELLLTPAAERALQDDLTCVDPARRPTVQLLEPAELNRLGGFNFHQGCLGFADRPAVRIGES